MEDKNKKSDKIGRIIGTGISGAVLGAVIGGPIGAIVGTTIGAFSGGGLASVVGALNLLHDDIVDNDDTSKDKEE
jgi:outer membrane lipoprotein SlyB